MSVEPLRWWHLPAVQALEVELFAPDDWSPEVFWSELAERPATSYVVLLDDQTVQGYAGVAVHGGGEHIEAHVQTMAVAPALQGRGHGRTLLRELLSRAVAAGATKVLLEVRSDNPVAQALYVRAGFVPLRTRRRYYQPSGADAVEMALGDPAAGLAALAPAPAPAPAPGDRDPHVVVGTTPAGSRSRVKVEVRAEGEWEGGGGAA